MYNFEETNAENSNKKKFCSRINLKLSCFHAGILHFKLKYILIMHTIICIINDKIILKVYLFVAKIEKILKIVCILTRLNEMTP